MSFGPLRIEYDDAVLRPRAWTVLQSQWAAELLAERPEGDVLELCAGAGQIGLAVAATTRRRLVCVDASAAACRYARRNAETAGLTDLVEVRDGDMAAVVGLDERFAVVIADPPWVPSAETYRFPEDPPDAIDGGPDGLDAARDCLRVAAAHLLPDGVVLLQLGSREQADALGAESGGVRLAEVRQGAGGVVALFSAA